MNLLQAVRVGQGFDAHRFAIPSGETSRELWLACIRWTDDEARGVPGLEGDSDGDVAAHALIDAMLSACDLGDIGGFFGVGAASDGAGKHGAPMLRTVAHACREAGWTFANATVTVIGNNPHIGAHRAEAARAMSDAAGMPVSLLATTTDHMGFTGAGEGVAAIATALAVRSDAAC
ncbi:MAG: 2-C-methyl-D-erythritol 2,4-cyclodiphosphate synthase [Bifidobacteriaceae bacterium]|nr:2-C-methyl-D-erythritol 2,4-cyclodiphosphate synthase [Bifidobacteriaceae bacterium]